MCFLCGFVSFLALSFFCPLCFLFSFSLRLSLLLGFTNLERNRLSRDYIDLRGSPFTANTPHLPRLFPHPQRGADSGARPVPRADLFGPGHTTIRDSNSARKQQPIGQGAEALLPNEKGCWGTQSCAASGEATRPRGPASPYGFTPAYLSSLFCHSTKLLAAPATFQKEKEYNVRLKT